MNRTPPFRACEHLNKKPSYFSAAVSMNRKEWETKDFKTLDDAKEYLDTVPKTYRYQTVYSRSRYTVVESVKVFSRVVSLEPVNDDVEKVGDGE